MGTTKYFLLIDSIFYSIWANQKVLWDLWFIFLVKHVSKDCSGMIRPQWFFQNTFWGSISFIFFVTLYCRIILFIVSTPIKIQKTVGLSHYLGNLPIVTLILLTYCIIFPFFAITDQPNTDIGIEIQMLFHYLPMFLALFSTNKYVVIYFDIRILVKTVGRGQQKSAQYFFE